jgi:hypothetical protein
MQALLAAYAVISACPAPGRSPRLGMLTELVLLGNAG